MTESTVRVCRLCGTLALLEDWEHDPHDVWGCADGIQHVLTHGAHIPDWVVRASRPLKVVM